MEPEGVSGYIGGVLQFSACHIPTQRTVLSLMNLPRLSFRPSAGTMVLAIILTCQLMIVLDASIIITALPEIHTDLGFSSTGLAWVQNAYVLTFGGLLLLGARAGDLLGRRRVFMAGLSLFTAASLLGGLAQSETWLLGARALQGVGAAIAAPSTLALLTTTFAEGAERGKAIAWYSSASAAGRQHRRAARRPADRPALLALRPVHQRPDWAGRHRAGSPLPPGHRAAARPLRPGRSGHVGAGHDGDRLRLHHAPPPMAGATASTLLAFASGAVLLFAFLRIELRVEQPITPLRLFADRTRSGAYVARLLTVAGMFSMFFFLTQFLQGVLGYSPLEAGVAFLPMTLVIFGLVRVVPRAVARIGDMPVLVGGLALALGGMAWLSQVTPETTYFPGIALPLLMMGFGMGSAFTPLTSAGVAGVGQADAGAASGLVNVAHQVGGAIGISVLVTVFAGAGGRNGSQHDVAHALGVAMTGSAAALAMALAVVVGVMWRPSVAPAGEPAEAR